MTTKLIDRQWPLSAMAALTYANIGAANGVTIVVPPGAILLRLLVLTTTAFNSATTTTLTATDGTTVFASAVDVKSTGSETVSNAPKYYPTGGTIAVTLAETGAAATAGAVFVIPEYVVTGRGNEIAE